MDLSTKGSTANVAPGFSSLIATMKWRAAADFDLMALGFKPDGTHNLVYFGSPKNPDGSRGDYATDGMQLSGDAGVDDTGGNNEEQLTMVDLSAYEKVAIIVMDYGAVSGSGGSARFDQGVNLDIQDDRGTSHSVHLDPTALGNTACIATIEKSGPFFKLVNSSNVGTFKGFPSNTRELVNGLGL